jgi:hypothetical protein
MSADPPLCFRYLTSISEYVLATGPCPTDPPNGTTPSQSSRAAGSYLMTVSRSKGRTSAERYTKRSGEDGKEYFRSNGCRATPHAWVDGPITPIPRRVGRWIFPPMGRRNYGYSFRDESKSRGRGVSSLEGRAWNMERGNRRWDIL